MKLYKIIAVIPFLTMFGCDQGPAANFEEYKVRSEHGDASAQNNLAVMYNKGVIVDGEVVVEKDCARAMELWADAMRQGNAMAKRNYDEVRESHDCPEYSDSEEGGDSHTQG